ncbi:MAG: flagellar basal body rod protein FlgC [Bacteroidota bacterium]|nr:flagellar basal body rod protein FlgC [Hyphomicrobiaceae bacterium]
MADPLKVILKIAASGLEAQSNRMRIVSENLANAESTGKTPGADPYTRKVITFQSELDEATSANLVKVDRIEQNHSPYRIEHDPGNPAADANGYVKLPNVNVLVEMADMREANRSYEANLQVMRQARDMITMTIDLLRST